METRPTLITRKSCWNPLICDIIRHFLNLYLFKLVKKRIDESTKFRLPQTVCSNRTSVITDGAIIRFTSIVTSRSSIWTNTTRKFPPQLRTKSPFFRGLAAKCLLQSVVENLSTHSRRQKWSTRSRAFRIVIFHNTKCFLNAWKFEGKPNMHSLLDQTSPVFRFQTSYFTIKQFLWSVDLFSLGKLMLSKVSKLLLFFMAKKKPQILKKLRTKVHSSEQHPQMTVRSSY